MIKAIETKFDGHFFRSRLEARWAVFFKTLGVPYAYEMEGFDLGGGYRYLPDFWLPQQEAWIEIKGAPPNEREIEVARRLSEAGHPVFIFHGEIPRDDSFDPGAIILRWGNFDEGYLWCQCMRCGAFGITFNGRSHRLPCHQQGGACHLPDEGDKGYSYDAPKIIRAYDAARQERFDE
jgi:hypothetical protein